MRNFVNTAYVQYTFKGERMAAKSNRVVISSLQSDSILRGKVICSGTKGRWRLDIVRRDSGKNVYSLCGTDNRLFYFEPLSQYSYTLLFSAQKGCCLRLYNVPDAVSETLWQDLP